MADLQEKIKGFEQDVSDVKNSLEKLKSETDQGKIDSKKKEANEKIISLQSDIDKQLKKLEEHADEHAGDIESLKKLKESLSSIHLELGDLKKTVEKKSDENHDSKEAKDDEKEGTPSLWASIFYGGIVAKGLGSLPLIGDSLKEWAAKKKKESAKEKKEEEKKEKKGFFAKAWNVVKYSAIASGALWLARKAIPDSWMDKAKGWFGLGDEKKDSQNNPSQTSDYPPLTPPGNKEGDISDKEEKKEEQESSDPALVADDQNKDAKENTDNKEQESPQEQTAVAEIDKMRGEGISDLFIMTRLFEYGFLPKVNPHNWKGFSFSGKAWKENFLFVADGGPISKQMDKMAGMKAKMNNWLIASTSVSKEQITKMKISAMKQNPNLEVLFDKKIAALAEMDAFLAKNPQADYKQFAEKFDVKGSPINIKELGSDMKLLKQRVEGHFDVYADREKQVAALDKEIREIQTQAEAKMADYEKQAKEAQKDPKKLEAIRKESKNYINEYNKKIQQANALLGEDLAKIPTKAELVQLATNHSSVDHLTKINGGIDSFLEKSKLGKVAGGAGRIMLGIAVWRIATKGFDDVSKQGFLSKETGMDALDLGAGMVPVAGGLYDAYMAIRGKDLNGRDMRTSERWIRGSVGVASTVLDCFTFGIGGTALKAVTKTSVKIGTKVAEKAAEKAGEKIIQEAGKEVTEKAVQEVAEQTGKKVSEQVVASGTKETVVSGVKIGAKVMTYGFLGYTVGQEVVSMAVPVKSLAGAAVNTVKDATHPNPTF